MIVRCPDCLTKYEIATQKFPEGGVKVRCPRCKAVFPVGTFGSESSGAGPATTPPQAAPGNEPRSRSGEVLAGSFGPPRERDSDRPGSGGDGSGHVGDAEPHDEDRSGNGERPVATAAPPRRQVLDPAVARRMARAMLTEMLLARGEDLNRSREAGTVLRDFGNEIADALALYEERVSAELPGADQIFREAVNAVLGGDRPLL